ncbi:secretion protein HlyD [Kaistia sp. 32K]|uniref:HlyD family secretion protein n=1 Tax=Kaistia sp. 32K TaxID=2795690 RepID=UPI00191578EA|nr:HlyD family efflux transporter periplasmic adaptor subunit [Kaistia sp. 32K]BCP51826.1 secretion protein HlyD [Kaistia sp. 32K]
MEAGRASALVALLLLAGCGDGGDDALLHGYVDADYVLAGAEASGRLTALSVRRGDPVAADAPLFTLDDRDETAALAQARAELAQAKASLQDLRTGKRPEEIRVLDAQLADAEASLTVAQKSYDRNRDLSTRAVVAIATLDQAKADLDSAAARVQVARENRAVANLPARPDQIAAAEQQVEALAAAVTAAETKLARRSQRAASAGQIEDVFYQIGEIVPAGQAVVSLLPDGARKILFFVPEPARATVRPGQRVALSCDSCADGLAATVSSIATNAEFTPPVIYSKESRAKLVYRVEARPEGEAQKLDPGQPVDVRLPAGEK